ncbi:hypothetical protein Nepgr_001027 [Nepenthes gracilis]|uniref:glucan endo-1,3-beta-D-glucosidase n=1 Tax=Nepenthes gracilis TaxID=150966 RepID=A0AAD3P4G8_NEPGR|nr:hypothetical protein Nepgr_001027 [Nepenthes gracilis]
MNMGWLFYGVVGYMILSIIGSRVDGIGANWGTQATHPLQPEIVVRLLKDNEIQKVKLFEADSSILNALSNSGIEVMLGIPNDMLYSLATDASAAEDWVSQNLSSHISSVDIRYVAAGNEPLLATYNGSYLTTTLPALQNIRSAVVNAGYGNQVKVTVPLNAAVYQSSTTVPSGGDFRADIHDLMLQIVDFLNAGGAPFLVNIYPFISLYDDPHFPFDYAFFNGYSLPLNDNGKTYDNVFDANYDTLVWALEKNGYGNLSIIVGEIGWPTDGDKNANLTLAQRFNQGCINHISSGNGTPMRPNASIDAYLFSLIDEDDKSTEPGNFERHWGIFYFDGTPKYELNLGTSNSGLVAAKGVTYLRKQWCVMSPSASLGDPEVAPSVSYACANADCTSLGYETSCGNLNARQNISYAFNNYYQRQDQLDSACKFSNLSVVTKADPSAGTCKFFIMIDTTSSDAVVSISFPRMHVVLLLLLLGTL